VSATLARPPAGGGGPSARYRVEVRREVSPRWTFRLSPRTGADRLARMRGRVLHRLLHAGEEAVHVRIVQLSADRVLFGARAGSRDAAEWGIERMRVATGIDLDLRPFYERFRFDPLIGPSVRRIPHLRPAGRPVAFEALAWAVCEQLIEYERAAAIERRLIAALGRRCDETWLADSPTAATIAAQAPALVASLDLAESRAIALIRVAREVASGRVELDGADHEAGWRRLRAIPGIGPWTLQTMALNAQGRLDQLPAGDLAYLKLVGRLQNADPRSRATEAEVVRFFARFDPWCGLAGLHALRGAGVRAAPGLAA
jgi:3-methyladenine DNA glycosylase/8-oxoguanine DNA glycosylase